MEYTIPRHKQIGITSPLNECISQTGSVKNTPQKSQKRLDKSPKNKKLPKSSQNKLKKGRKSYMKKQIWWLSYWLSAWVTHNAKIQIFPITIFIQIFVCINFCIHIYSDIFLYRSLDTDISGYYQNHIQFNAKFAKF